MHRSKLLLLLFFFTLHPIAADEYKPLFSKELLEKAEPEARARMQALDDENRRRWQNNQKSEPAKTQPSGSADRGVVYRYIDANGKVQFSEKPVGDNSIPIRVQSEAPTAQSLEEHAQSQRAQQTLLNDFEERQKVRDRKANEIAEAGAKRRQHNDRCEGLFLEINDYERGGVAYYELDDEGNRRYLSDKEVAAEVTELKEIYTQNCGELTNRKRSE